MALNRELPQRFQSKARLPFKIKKVDTNSVLEVIKLSWFSLLSLSLYYPFALSKLRKLIWSETFFEKNNFEYTGEGKRLFKNYLTAIIFLITSFLAVELLKRFSPFFSDVLGIALILILILALIPRVYFGFRRFLLNHSKYRGIRFELNPKAQIRFTSIYIFGLFLTVATFGLYGIFTKNRLDRILWNNTSLGNKKFFNTSEGIVLFWEYLRGLILCIPTLGIYFFWMQARILRYKAKNLYLGHHNFKLDIKGKDLLIHSLKDLGIIIITLGVGIIWIPIRRFSFYLERLTYCGQIDFSTIEQVIDDPEDAFAKSFGDLLNVGS